MVVQLVTLDQEHTHANLVWCLVLDLLDCVQVKQDTLNVLLAIADRVSNKLGNALRLLKDKQVVVVDVDGLSSDGEVLQEDVTNFLLSRLHDVVFRVDHPEMGLLGVGDLSVGTWDVVNSLDHMLHDLDKDVLNGGQSVLLLILLFLVLLGALGSSEHNLCALDLNIQRQERLLEGSIRVVFAPDDLLGQWVLPIFLAEAPEELDVFVDGVGSKLASLVTHERGDRVEEGLGLITVEVLKLLA